MRPRSLELLCLTLAAAAVAGCAVAPPPPPPPPPLTPEQREAREREARERAAQQAAREAAFAQEERTLYGNGGSVPRGLRPYDQRLSNYAEYRGPSTVGAERMSRVAKPYRHVQIFVKNGASAAQITRYGTYAAQVRDVTIYPMTLRATHRYGSSLSDAVNRLCPPVRDYRPADSREYSNTADIDEFLETKLGPDGPKIWRYGSPSAPSCRLMDFGD